MIEPRLGPSFLTPDQLAFQVFRTSNERLAALPIQWRGVVLLRIQQGFSIADAEAKMASGEWIQYTEPHDVYLAYSGKIAA